MKLKSVESEMPEVAEPKNPLRRRLCRDDFLKFCLEYHGDIFFSPVDFHREFCADLQALILAPGHKRMARAAPRGSGKTTMSILATEWAILYGHKRCSVWFCVNEAKATERADMLQGQLLTNRLLADDFPEICAPLKVEGKTDWISNGKRLPNGAWTLWRSIDGGNLGTLLDFQRPDLIAIDDPEDTSTIRKTGANTQSVTAQKRFDRIDKEISFLPERGKGALLMVTTIRSRGCLSDEYTDPETKAAWEGKVYSALDFGEVNDFTPARDALWNSYLALCGSKDSGQEPHEDALMLEAYTPEILKIDRATFESFAPRLKKALRFFANNEFRMRAGISELDPVRIPVWDFFWQVGSDSRGKEIVWSELQNQPLDDPFTKQMRFTEKQLWTHQIEIVQYGNENNFRLGAVVVGTDAIVYEQKRVARTGGQKHLIECGSILPNGMESRSDFIARGLGILKEQWKDRNFQYVAVDVSGVSGRDKGEWSEAVAHFCAVNRPWIALQDCAEWDENQAARAMYKNFCVETESNPFGVVKWHSVHFKNRLAAAYNDPTHPITFFKPDDGDDSLWKYIRSQTSEQYTREFIPDKTEKKSVVEKWVPVPKFRNQTQFWKCAAMIECLADIAQSCAPKDRSRPKIENRHAERAVQPRRF